MGLISNIYALAQDINEIKDTWDRWRECKRPVSSPSPINPQPTLPIGPSKRIKSVKIDWRSLITAADKSDNFPMTQAANGFIYTSYGDGWGFQKQGPKRSLGISRLSAALRPKDSARSAIDIWHGNGKSYGLLAKGHNLYMLHGPGSLDDAMETTNIFRFALEPFEIKSRAHLWSFDKGIAHPTFVQFGKDNRYSPDGYVYLFSTHFTKQRFMIQDDPAELWLMRCKPESLMQKDQYEYFCGRPGVEKWTKNIRQIRPVAYQHKSFLPQVAYHPEIDRFSMWNWSEFHGDEDDMATWQTTVSLYESPKVYGPWTKVQTFDHFGQGHINPSIFNLNWATGWGQFPDLWMVFSGFVKTDKFYAARAKIIT